MISQSRFPGRTAAAGVTPVPRRPAVPPGAPEPPKGVPGSGTLPEGAAPGPVPARPPASETGPGIPHTPGAGSAGVCSPAPGARSWVLELPAGMKTLSLNDRHHWAERGRRARDLKQAAWALARSHHVPPLERIFIVVEYQPPDRRHRDADNIPAASGKHLIDGIVAAGVIPDDEAIRYVDSVRYKIGPVYPKGRLVLHISEAPEAGLPRIGTCHD